MKEVLFYAHVMLFVFSFAFTAGISILTERIARGRNPATIHTVFSAAAGDGGWLRAGS